MDELRAQVGDSLKKLEEAQLAVARLEKSKVLAKREIQILHEQLVRTFE
jgi:hypothetical protein